MTIELKGCPWCGHIPIVEPWHGGSPTKHMVGCQYYQCPANPSVTAETKRKAINTWNRRTRSD